MRILKNNAKILLMILMVFIVSGCSEDNYSDNACIDNISELYSNGKIDYTKVTGEPCKSLDLGVLKHRTTRTRTNYEAYYSANTYINADKANYNNKIDSVNNDLGLQIKDLKVIYQNDLFQKLIMSISLMVFILFKLIKNEPDSEESADDTLAFFTLMIMTWGLLMFTTKTEESTMPITKASIWLNNYFARVSELALLSEVSEASDIVRFKSKNEALIDISDFVKLNVCNSESQKFTMENKRYALNGFDNQKEMAEFYYRKNIPYIILDVDERIDGQKISYELSDDGFTSRVYFANCGQSLFASSNISNDTVDLMEQMKFKKLLDTTIKSKSIVNGLATLKAEFISKTGGGVSTNDQFVELLTLFTDEYKKGMIWGTILIEDSVKANTDSIVDKYVAKFYNYFKPKITTDFSNLYALQGFADDIYDNIIASQCLSEGSFVKETQNKIKDFNNNYGEIEQLDCASFTDKEIYSAVANAYNYKNNKILIDDKRLSIQENTFDIVEASTVDLIKQYEIANTAFNYHLNKVSNFNIDLAYYYNQGGHSQGKFTNYLYNHKNQYMRVHARIMDSSRIDFSKSLPNFSFDPEPRIKTDVYTVNAFLKNLTAQIDIKTADVSTNITNSMLEYSMDNSNANYGDTLNSDSGGMGDTLNAYLENSSESFKAVRKMVCNGDPKLCNDKLKNFDGVKEWHTLASGLKENGAKATIVASTAYIALSGISGLLKFGKRKGDTKKVIFGNRSKVGAMAIVADGLKAVAGTIAMIGLFATILGNLMLALFQIPTFVLEWFVQSQIIYLDILPIMLITVCTILMMTKFTVEGYKKGLTLVLQMVSYPPLMSVVMPIMAFLITFSSSHLLNEIPSISGLVMIDSSDTLTEIINAILAIGTILFVAFIGLLMITKYIIKTFKAITDNRFYDGAFNQGIQSVGKIQKVVVVSAGGVLGKKSAAHVGKKVGKNLLRNTVK